MYDFLQSIVNTTHCYYPLTSLDGSYHYGVRETNLIRETKKNKFDFLKDFLDLFFSVNKVKGFLDREHLNVDGKFTSDPGGGIGKAQKYNRKSCQN